VGLEEEPETNNDESGLQHNCLLLNKKKRSFSLINRMPEIIEINKQLSYGEKDKKKRVWCTLISLILFLIDL
jgi:hypothetical protein